MDTLQTFQNASPEGKLDMFEEAYDGWVKSNAALVKRDEQIAALAFLVEAETKRADALTTELTQRDIERAAEMALQVNVLQEYAAVEAGLRNRVAILEADLAETDRAANIAINAHLRMAQEQAEKVKKLRRAMLEIAITCNAELFDIEDVENAELDDSKKTLRHIENYVDEVLESTKLRASDVIGEGENKK